MKKFITNRYTLYTIGIIVVFLLWFLLSILINKDLTIIPDPINTTKYLFNNVLNQQYIYSCLLWSIVRLLIGFLLSFIVALLFGTLAGNHAWLEKILKPLMVVLKSVPTACITFLFLVLFTSRYAPIFVVIIICFPILYDSVLNGVKNVEKTISEALKIDGGSIINNSITVKVPLAIPYILVGVASSFALSFKIEIMAEIITGDTKNGLGSAILAAQKSDPTNLIPIFAYSLIAVIIILIVTAISDVIKKAFKKKYQF